MGKGAWGVFINAVKIYLACALVLKEKLLPLINELVVISKYLGVIHLWRPQIVRNFVPLTSCAPSKNKRVYRHGTKSVDCQLKLKTLVMVYFGLFCDRIPLMFTIPRRNFHQFAANLIFIWYPVTVSANQEFNRYFISSKW